MFMKSVKYTMCRLMCFLVLCVPLITAAEVDLYFQDKVSEGERRYSELVKKSESYGECWKKAMSDLQLGCKRLTEEVQSRLALSFANCFLEHAGLDPCKCSNDMPIARCLKNSSDRVFSTYTEFFTHTQSICHYLQHREWQEEASKTVLMLTENSKAVSKKLDDSSKFQSQILSMQQEALNEQQKMISTSQVLNTELVKSRENARQVFEDFKSTTGEQRLLLFEVFDRVKNLQNFVLGEFSGVYTFCFYLLSAVVAYLLTSVQRTADSRLWLILIISANAALERIVTAYSLQEAALDINPLDGNKFLYSRIWLCRKIMIALCLIILTVFYYRYKDYNAINNQLLKEIQRQNIEIQMYLKGLSHHESFLSSSILQSSTVLSSVAFQSERKEEKAISPAPSKNNLELNGVKNSVSSKVLSNRSENKENDHPLIISSSDLTVTLKKAIKVRSPASSQKKNSRVKSQGNTPKTPFTESNNSFELASPVPRRYNLRSSSRLNSPSSPQ